MESSSSRAVSEMQHNDSSSLSELEDDWMPEIAPTRKRPSSRCSRKCTNNEHSQRRCDPPSSANRPPEKVEHTEPESSKQLVTASIGGKNYVLPFEYVDACLKEKLMESISSSLSKGRHPTEGLENLDTQHRNEIINILFTSIEHENVLQKMNLCGDFSVEKCKEPKKKTDTSSTEVEKRTDEPLECDGTLSMKSAKELKIDRTPFQCPVASCGDFVCAAFFSSHLKVEHSGILMEGIIPGQPRTILVDPKLNTTGKNHCNIVYYMVTKLRDFGINEFKNTVPILLMSSKFKFTELEGDHPSSSSLPVVAAQHHYIFWVTGIASESLRIQYSLEIGSHHRQSGWILPLGLSHDLRSVYQSGTGTIISQSRVEQLTRRSDKLLEMRLVFS